MRLCLMRPNDLVWNYWVNNYLLGNEPPTFDVLYWNSDSTRLPAKVWFEGATKQNGRWWEHWKAWLLARSGSQKGAPASPGNSTYKPLVEAPGTYVYE